MKAPVKVAAAMGEDPVYGMTSRRWLCAGGAEGILPNGATSRQLAAVAVAFRKHAALNLNAMLRNPITVEDHQNSRFVCEPLRLLDYCQIQRWRCLCHRHHQRASQGSQKAARVYQRHARVARWS